MSDENQQPKMTVSMSETIGAIGAALAKAQAVMGPALKDATNPHFKSSYASLASCFEAITPLHENGIGVTQIPLNCGEGVLVATMLIHASGEWIRGELWMPVSKADAQGYGSALTYNRRYSIQLLCGLASDDDDGNAAAASPGQGYQRAPQQQQQRAPVKAAAPANLATFSSLCDRVDAAEDAPQINAVVAATKKAHEEGAISDSHLEQIKSAVTKKRAAFGPSANANGGAS